jgi:hypothetical protein
VHEALECSLWIAGVSRHQEKNKFAPPGSPTTTTSVGCPQQDACVGADIWMECIGRRPCALFGPGTILERGLEGETENGREVGPSGSSGAGGWGVDYVLVRES